ncbi:MAG TPA: KUP/HAK/KT family potassium transporter, partial [Longimicrobiales bacterium]|nr:KUP/HAK/KT family potassium transporter [Longimicrobiales bacterium]
HGGWFPLAIALVMFTLMTTWKRGKAILAERFEGRPLPVADFLKSLEARPPSRVPGTAVFMTSRAQGVPRALLHNLKHNRVLHERVLLLTVDIQDVPRVPEAERYSVTDLGRGFHRVVAHFGFTESPDVPEILRKAGIPGYEYREMTNSFFLGEVSVIVGENPVMARWRSVLFERMTRNALRASAYFNLPPNRVVGMSAQVEI